MSKVWLVTGASRGLGRVLVEAALELGDRVVATARNPDMLRGLPANRVKVLALDVRDRARVLDVVAQGTAAFGQIDVVVNNAGYGHVGAIEEVTAEDARDIMDTDFFGALWVTQAVLPQFRQRGAGHVVQISSVGGVGSMPFFGLYNAAKWALEGFSEALAQEVGPLGIRVTLVEAGSMATDWARSSMRFSTPMRAYDGRRKEILGVTEVPWDVTQPADPLEMEPVDAARAIRAHVERKSGPLRLLVGEDAPGHVKTAVERRLDGYREDPRFVWP